MKELKKMIDKAKLSKSKESVLIKKLPVNSAQKELEDLLELVRPEVKLMDMVHLQLLENIHYLQVHIMCKNQIQPKVIKPIN